MPLKRGYSKASIDYNIAHGIASGQDPRKAVAAAYSTARSAALSAGKLDRYRELLPKGDDFTQLLMVGADRIGALPPDIRAMNEDQAFAELERLDALSASRGLTPDEQDRLVAIEKRLEQFVPEAVLQKAAEAEARAARGEQVVPETVLRPGEREQVLEPITIVAPNPVDVTHTVDLPTQSDKKSLVALGAAGLFGLLYALSNKKFG